MIALKGLDHIGIRVADFQRSVDFYRQFGFTVVREDHAEGVTVLRHANGVELNLLDSALRPHQPHNVLMDEAVKHPGYTHIALQVADITHVAHYVTARGIVISEGPVTFGDGKTSIFFRDPDRNVIELTQHGQEQTMGNQQETAV